MKKATIYRMVTKDHICPYGIKSKYLLEQKNFKVEDNHLKNRAETDKFKEKHNVKTTPQTFIDGKRIGGLDDLQKYFGVKTIKQTGKTYQPVIVVFLAAFLIALSTNINALGDINLIRTLELFIAFSMCILAILKLKDLFSFTNQFITYDLLAKKYIPYAYIYPFIEFFAGCFMIANKYILLAAPFAFFIGTIGAISVFKAVYIEKRDLKCACVGGDSNVPLGFISLTENIMMILMSIWMFVKICYLGH